MIATLGLAGLRVSELCERDRQDIDLTRARIRVADSKKAAGVRVVDIRPRLLKELRAYYEGRPRAERDQALIVAHVTPHTLRRTYITFMLAAGFHVPYVQDRVGHADPTTTLAIYAHVICGADRDALRAELRALLGEDRPADDELARR